MTDNNEIERCGFLCVHEEAVEQVLDEMPDDETLYDLAELFKVFWRLHPDQDSVRAV